MNTGKRYSFWKVFWIVAAFYFLTFAVELVARLLSPEISENKWDDFLSWKHLGQQMGGLFFTSAFYFFTVNKLHQLMVERKNTYSYLVVCVVAAVVLIFYQYINFRYIRPEVMRQSNAGLLLFIHLVSAAMYLSISFMAAYLTYLRDEKKQRKVLEEQKMQLEMEKSQANFNFLKAQINPHFLHNTLNFLYAKSLPYSAELSEGILTLSDIMRYALNEANTKDGKAPLRDEIEHVRNVIKINQLRFNNNLNVQFEVEGILNGATIIPFVLITLVENAFKHGDLKNAAEPIIIKMKVDKKSVWFYCRNKKKQGPKELSTGIGLENIRKRLDLAYGNNYAFIVKDDVEFYSSELTITQP